MVKVKEAAFLNGFSWFFGFQLALKKVTNPSSASPPLRFASFFPTASLPQTKQQQIVMIKMDKMVFFMFFS